MQNKNRQLEEEIYSSRLSSENIDYEIEILEKEIELQSSIRDSLFENKLKKTNKFSISSAKQKDQEKNNDLSDLTLESKVNQLKKFITRQNSSLIIDTVLNDFKILKKKFEKSTIEKEIKTSFIETITVKFDPLEVNDSSPVSVRVTTDFYTVLDLLEEVCLLQGLNYKSFDLYDEDDKIIPLTQILKIHLNIKPDAMVNRFVFLKKKYKQSNLNSIENQINFNKNLLNNSEKNFDDIKLMNNDLIPAEDTTIKTFVNIILYFFLVVCVFTQCLTRFNIKQNFFINSGVKKNIFQKRFFSNNVNELQNSFENIMNSELLYEWLYKVYLNIFDFKGIARFFYFLYKIIFYRIKFYFF